MVQKKLIILAGWLFSIASLIYVAYMLLTFRDWHSLSKVFAEAGIAQFAWLLYVLLLLPLNWFAEAYKWQRVCSRLQKFSIISSLRAVLSGAATGFITPNKLGDIAGRIVYLHEANRKPAISLAVVNSLTQNMAILLAGIPMLILFLLDNQLPAGIKTEILIPVFIAVLMALLLFFYFLPRMIAAIKSQKLREYFRGIETYNKRDLLVITFISLLRLLIFNLQLYFLLKFFGVELSFINALISIPVSYLFITFTPSLALSEGLVRSSWAAVIIGQYADNTAGIILAGTGLWLINVVMPAIVGNALLLLNKNQSCEG